MKTLPVVFLVATLTGCQPEPKRNHVTFYVNNAGTIAWRFDHTRYEAWYCILGDPVWHHVRENIPFSFEEATNTKPRTP